MSLRLTFVQQASAPEANLSALCAQFGISRPTGYKWLARYQAGGVGALAEQSRRPHSHPRQTEAALEAQALALRTQHPAWGGRKLRARLQQVFPDTPAPAASTLTAILRRHGLLAPTPTPRPPAAHQRFEHPAPNDLWQMDFKGALPLSATPARCHPLTVLDDHSRFALGLVACANEQTATVQAALTALFRVYGLPLRVLCDNGSPWGTGGAPTRWTPLRVWLVRLGVGMSHGRPYHPQTQGKDERFHRSLTAEVLAPQPLRDVPHAQRVFDAWRQVYNHERPHEALQLAVPASRYHPSPRPFPETLPPLEYAATDAVRRVQQEGWISWQGRAYRIGRAFVGQPVGVRATDEAGCYAVYFAAHCVASLDTRRGTAYPVLEHRPVVNHVPEHL